MGAPTERIMAEREERIFRFCEGKAHEIIAELSTSGGDHQADVDLLEGLIETWRSLQVGARADADAIDLRERGVC